MIQPTVKNLRRAAERAGATLEGGPVGRWYSYNIVAPDGKQWGGIGAHCLKVEWLNGDAKYRAESIGDALERLEQERLVDCPHDCDCREEESL